MLKKSRSNKDHNDKGKSDRLYLNLTKKILTGLTYNLDSILGFAVLYVSSFYSIHIQATEL